MTESYLCKTSTVDQLYYQTVVYDRQAEQILARFSSAIRQAVSSVLVTLGKESDVNMRDSLTQDAKIWVVTYAGLLPGDGSGKLSDWEEISDGDEHQVRLLITHQLKLILNRIVGKQKSLGQSLDTLIDHDLEPQHFDNGDDMMQEAEYRRRYPLMARSVFDGETQQEIADSLGVHRNTIITRMSGEKLRFMSNQVRRDGLKTTGDETIEELEEAYAYLHHSRPSQPVRSNTVSRTGHRQIIGGLWFQERCLDCNQDCNASSDHVSHMCRCCAILAGSAVNT